MLQICIPYCHVTVSTAITMVTNENQNDMRQDTVQYSLVHESSLSEEDNNNTNNDNIIIRFM